MSKHKPSKPAHRPKIAAKAQGAAQAVARSPSNERLRSPPAGSTASPPKHDAPEQEALVVENPVTALQADSPPEHHDPRQEALPVEKPVAALADDGKQMMTGSESKNAPDFSSPAINVWASQAKLLEVAQANMKFAFEFPQRLATIRSPNEFFSVIAEFTHKRIAMFQQYSKK